MAFEKYDKPAHAGKGWSKPSGAISKNGHIRLNRLAIEKVDAASVTHVTLHYDNDNDRVGLLPCDESDPCAVKVHRIEKDKAVYLSAKSFLRHFGIDDCYLGLRPEPYLDGKMIVLDFGKSK